MPVDIEQVRDARVNEAFLYDIRTYRQTNMSAWKSRISTVDKMYRGEWAGVFPDETLHQLAPAVMNLVQVGMDDLAKLVSESLASVRCVPDSDSQRQERRANVRESIAQTYWDVNQGQLIIPRLAMDIAGCGGCFVVVDTVHGDYPCFHRIDPRMAFPDTFNGRITDLLVAQTMKIRQAASLFPRFAPWLNSITADNADACEVLEYYAADECVQALMATKTGVPNRNLTKIVKRWYPKIDQPPVAMAMLDSFDGEFRGMFDQVAGSLNVKNRIVQLMLDYTDKLVYAGKVSKGLLNPEEVDGPEAHWRLDPNVLDSQIGRLAPAGSSPQLFALLDYLDREQRAGTSYPAARQGEVSQSIASASFVSATQGALTSSVRNIQRLIAGMREQLNVVAFRLDESELDSQKELTRPLNKKTTYRPSTDIAGRTNNRVIYGAGAGFDRMQADVRILQHRTNGLISAQTAREQIDYLDDPQIEEDQIAEEQMHIALAQKFLAEAPWDVVAKTVIQLKAGKTLVEAIEEVMSQQAPPAQAATPELPSGPQAAQAGGPLAALTEQTSIAKGATNLPPANNVVLGAA